MRMEKPDRPDLLPASMQLASTPPGAGDVPTRMDTHVHSLASSGPAIKALGLIGCPESYSHPEAVFAQAKLRGMDLVTLTDHDTIDGALMLVEKGYPGVVIGEEVTVNFPEDRCKLHVLVWCLTPELHEQLATLNLRTDVYQFAAWLHERNLPHSLAHPLYDQSNRLTPWHIDRCALLFKGFEVLNGAHSGSHRAVLDAYLRSFNAGKAHRLIEQHQLTPHFHRIWEKATTAGSDDHGLLNVGRTYTQVRLGDALATNVPPACIDRSGKLTCPREFFRVVMHARCTPMGDAGHSALLAHQLTTVGAQFAARAIVPKATPTGRHVAGKLLRFAGAKVPGVSPITLALHAAKRKLSRKRNRLDPVLEALRVGFVQVGARYPDLLERLEEGRWLEGSALSQHERMASFADDLYDAMHRAMASGAFDAVRSKDASRLLDQLASYLVLEATQLPAIFSLFHQNRERRLLERIAHECAGDAFDATAPEAAVANDAPSSIAPSHTPHYPHQPHHLHPTHSSPRAAQPAPSGGSPLDRPMRVMLFTDTLGDVNGVSRFIRNAADQARALGRELIVVTSTNFDVPDQPNIINVPPVLATKMPKYENLELVFPPLVRMLRLVDKLQPDVVHISTPGTVGLVGLLAARMLRAPMVGVYHTDFPAYVDRLLQDEALTGVCRSYMKGFYRGFARIFTRSEDYARSLTTLGMPADRLEALMPGIMVDEFHPRHRDARVELANGLVPGRVRALYVGRVSLEKNMPLLARAWRQADAQLQRLGVDAELVIIGDGPYRAQMQRDLGDARVRFLGFKYGQELSALYAACDLFVFPSVTDTLGQVVMESQASGMPVLVSDQGGPKEVTVDGETGFVIPADDERGWVDRIVDLCSNHPKRQRMGQAAHQAMQLFRMERSFEHFWQTHERAWVEHLAQHGVTPRTRAQQQRGVVEPPPALSSASQARAHAANRIPGYEHASD